MKKRQTARSRGVPRKSDATGLIELLREIKARIGTARTRAVQAANAELVRLYWDIGRLIHRRQQRAGWGAGVIPRLARRLRNDLPGQRGLSERNIGRMIAFYRCYSSPDRFLPQPVARSGRHSIVPQAVAETRSSEGSLLWTIPWGHHAVLLEKVKDASTRLWYMRQTLAGGWSRNVLLLMIQSHAHRRQGQAITNFDRLLPPPQSDLARQTLKDPYIFDFLSLQEPYQERELETNLLRQVERFLLELGQGFAFVGRQFALEVGDSDFRVDLLFFHLGLRC